MEETIAATEPTTELVEVCQDQDDRIQRQSHNFSIESILSSASSAFTVAAKQEKLRPIHLYSRFDLHTNLLRREILKTNQESRLQENDHTNTEVVEQHMEHREGDDDDDENEVDVGSRNSSPSQINTVPLLNINHAAPVFDVFGLSKGMKPYFNNYKS